jgi:adenylate cyclase
MTSGEDPARSITSGRVRKLAALLSADVEGYSRLMGEDEAATVQTITVYRSIVQTLVQEHRGRVVDSPGDNVLAEFPSVVDAVQCAVAIQRDLGVKNAPLRPERRMKFRVGINLGDVIVEGDRIYGDGVNIAARMESLATGGGICISGSVYEQVKGKMALRYEDLGTQSFKNIAAPVHVYRVREDSAAAAITESPRRLQAATSWRQSVLAVIALLAIGSAGVGAWHLASSTFFPAKPSIAVLPFVNISGDAQQEYLSDGMTEDLINELARLEGLLIIARNSAFTFKGKAVKPDQVSRELGVRYMVEGSVRKVNNRIRITAQLVDGTTGYHVWAQSYDRDLDDIFAVQEEIARMITRSLAVRLSTAEERNMARPPARNEDARKNLQEGIRLYLRFTARENARAREFFEKAVEQDPDSAPVYAYLAATHRQDWILGWTPNYEESEREAEKAGLKAVELARAEPEPKRSLPQALEQLGWVYLYQRKREQAGALAAEAVKHSPNFANGYALEAHVLAYDGKPQEALAKVEQAARLDPKPFFYDYHRGHAYWVWGFMTPEKDPRRVERYKEAEKYLRKALEGSPNFRPARSYLVATLSELGQPRKAAEEMARVRTIGGRPEYLRDPQKLREFIERVLPYRDDTIRARLIQVWQAAEAGT